MAALVQAVGELGVAPILQVPGGRGATPAPARGTTPTPACTGGPRSHQDPRRGSGVPSFHRIQVEVFRRPPLLPGCRL